MGGGMSKLTLDSRVTLLETHVKDLRREVEQLGQFGQAPSYEAIWRMWQAEKEDNVVARVALRDTQTALDGIVEELQGLVGLLRDGHSAVVASAPAGFRGGSVRVWEAMSESRGVKDTGSVALAPRSKDRARPATLCWPTRPSACTVSGSFSAPGQAHA
jgi:hypothetical protein